MIKDDLPAAETSIFAYKRLLPVLWKQLTDSKAVIVYDLPKMLSLIATKLNANFLIHMKLMRIRQSRCQKEEAPTPKDARASFNNRVGGWLRI